VFTFFKRVLRAALFLDQADKKTAPRRDEPGSAVDDRVLTPASWPGAEQKSSPLVWGGGCCG
jgi:hypothetical protein